MAGTVVDSPTEEGDAAADEPATRSGGSPPTSSGIFPFCLYHCPRIADANPGMGAEEVARLLGTGWRRLPERGRVVWGVAKCQGSPGEGRPRDGFLISQTLSIADFRALRGCPPSVARR